MSAGISVEIDVTRVTGSIARLLTQLADTTPANRALATQIFGWVQRNFDVEGHMQTPPWVPLKPSTLEQKRKHGWSSKPLIRTGNLRQSFAQFYSRAVAGVGAQASFGVDYALVHEKGSEHVPARPMLPSERVVLRYAKDVYGVFVKKAIGRSGLEQ